MLILFVLQKKFYIPFSFILPSFKTELRFFLAIFRGEGKGLLLSLNGISAIQKNKPLS